VRTPMIAPTDEYTDAPAASPEAAAAMIVRALIERPTRIDVPVSTLAEFGSLFAPSIANLVRSRLHHASSDSGAPVGETEERKPTPPAPFGVLPALTGGATLRRIGRLLPGVHW